MESHGYTCAAIRNPQTDPAHSDPMGSGNGTDLREKREGAKRKATFLKATPPLLFPEMGDHGDLVEAQLVDVYR